VKKFNMRL